MKLDRKGETRWAVFGAFFYSILTALSTVYLTEGATFSGKGYLSVGDSTNALGWQPSNPNKSLTVALWFKLSIPSGQTISNDMVILANGNGDTNANSSYQFRFRADIATIQFVARGGAPCVRTLIERPYLERWYHIAVKRKREVLTFYVDGRVVTPPEGDPVNLGDASSNGSGIVIGGTPSGQNLLGDVQEVIVYQNDGAVGSWLFNDLPAAALPDLKGYFKLAYSTNLADQTKNFAIPPPPGTETLAQNPNGSASFEETDKSGEQSLFDSLKNGGRDALTPLSGGFSWEQTVFSRPTPGIPFEFQIAYRSGLAASTAKIGDNDVYERPALSPGWRHTFETRIMPRPADNERHLIAWDGSIEDWVRTNSRGAFRPRHREYRGELATVVDDNGQEWMEWTTPERKIFKYFTPTINEADPLEIQNLAGRLREIRDYNGNRLQLNWDGAVGVLTQAVDSATGVYDLAYEGNALKQLRFKQWEVNFNYDSSNRLTSKWLTNRAPAESAITKTDLNTKWEFRYGTNGLLNAVIDPRNYTNVTAQYDQYGRKTNEIDALNRTNSTRYGTPGNRQVTRIDPGNYSWIETYDRKGHLIAQQDPLTNVTRFAYDTNGNQIRITEPLGWETNIGYDDRANMIARTNALNEVTLWMIHTNFNKAIKQITPQPIDGNGWTTWTNYFEIDDKTGNLLSHYDFLGRTQSYLVRYKYDSRGLMTNSFDANGNRTSIGYDVNGFPSLKTDPATNTWRSVNNDLGWKVSETNPLDETVAREFDLNGHAVLTVDGLFRRYTNQFDANGNLELAFDAKGNATKSVYDAANQKTNMVDRTGTNVWTYQYNSRGRLERTTDPLKNETIFG